MSARTALPESAAAKWQAVGLAKESLSALNGCRTKTAASDGKKGTTA